MFNFRNKDKRNIPEAEALLKVEEKIKNLAFKDEPAFNDFRQNLKSRILAARHRHFSMFEFFNKIARSLFFALNSRVFIPAIAIVLIVAVCLSMTSSLLPSGKSQWGKISELIISPAYAQDNFTAEATISDSLGIGADTAFIIKSKDVIDEQTLRTSIVLEPAADFDLAKIDEHTYRLTPKQTLEGKKVYDLKIASAYVDGNGATVERDYSWAFQVKDIFKVLNSIPGNQTTAVPLNTGIEITFSNENFLNYEKAFKIEPAVEGHFEIHKRTLVFVPKALVAGTVYKVTIDKDLLQVKDSDSKLAQNYVIQFETDPAGKKRDEYSEFSFQNNFNEIYSERQPALGVNMYNISQDKFPVEVYAFKSAEDFIGALNKQQQVPYWAQYNRTVYNTDVTKLSKISSFNIPLSPYGQNQYLVFPDKLPKGFYVVQANVNNVEIQTFIEVSDLTDYTTVTNNNTLIWLNNIKTKSPVAGAKVAVVGTDKSAVTGSDGTAVLPSSWLTNNSADSNQNYLLVDSGEETVVPVQFNYKNFAPDNIAPQSSAVDYWYYFYTDRLVYEVGDTASYWGYVKPRAVAKGSVVTIKLFSYQGYYDYYNNPLPLLQATSTINSDFTFTGKLPLGRLSAGYYNLEYFIGDEQIGSRSLSIEQYVKQAYKLEAAPAKLALFVGEKQTTEVKANFFEGTPVPNLAIKGVNASDQLKTDSQGSVLETYKAQGQSYGDYNNVCDGFSPIDSEEADISANACYTVFNFKNIHSGELTEVGKDSDGNSQQKFVLTLKKVDIAKANVEGATEDQFAHEAAPGVPVKIYLVETTYQAVKTGQYYDFVNKVVSDTYDYTSSRKEIASTTGITDSSGQFQYLFTAKTQHDYEVDIDVKDPSGADMNQAYYVYDQPSDNSYQDNSYQLQFKDKNQTDFSIGDNVAIQFTKGAAVNNQSLPAGKGQFLYYQMFNGLANYQIGDNSEYDFTFSDKYLPGVYVMGVYFDGETYHRSSGYGWWPGISPGLYVPFKKTDRKLNIEVTPDKTKYQPGGEVKLKIKVTDKDGKPAAAAVNLNLVDEAYYATFPESVDALGGLYGNTVDGGEQAFYISNPVPTMTRNDAEGGGCFLGGTKITMADHSTKNIEDLKIGDQVLTFTDETAKSYAAEKVTATISHEVNEYLVINDKLKITPIHRVFLNGQWQMIGNAKVGDWLLDETGAKVKIEKIEDKRGLFKVYNLTVEPYHTFFAEGFYVHNQKGDSPRSLFVDTAVFLDLNSGANGVATADFKLPDNITSWRVTAQAFTGNLFAGDKVIDLNSSLPAFVNTVFAKEYLTADKPEIKVRAYGDELMLENDNRINFKMGAPDLNFSSTTVGTAFNPSYFRLPNLVSGIHSITTSMSTSKGYHDAMLQNINVLDTRFKEIKTNFYDLAEGLKPAGAADGQTELVFADKNQGRFYNQLTSCYSCFAGDRLDQKLSRVVSADLLKKYFNENEAGTEDFDGSLYQGDDGGIALLPYASSDLELSAKAAFAAGNYFDQPRLLNYFYKILSANDSTEEQVGLALFGLSGLNEPVLTQAENYASLPDLNDQEKLYIGIALNHLGDAETARNIYAAVLKDKGEKFDNYLRVKISDNQDDILSATSLAAILAGGLGISDNEQLWNYVADNYTQDILIELEKIIYVSETLPKLAPGDSSFTVSFGGQTLNQALSNGGTVNLAVKASDLPSIKFSNIKGQIGLESTYEAPETNILPSNNSYVSLKREYWDNLIQTNTFKQDDIIQIRIYPSFQAAAPDSAYQITDLLPSGLALMTNLFSRGGTYSCSEYYPFEVDGQTVKFMLWKNWNKGDDCHQDYFSYYARVINPGVYKAESAVMQSLSAPSVKNYSGSDMVLIER
jgi:uncharacterized protein YfaS (alpha-2-macroglobulin family)